MGNFNQQLVSTGLSTVSFTVPLAGVYTLQGTLTGPEISGGATANTGVVVTVSQTPTGGSPTTMYTGPAGASGYKVVLNCAALDSISIVFSSSASIDSSALNLIKSVISFG